MQSFMIAYHGGRPPKSKEEGMAHMEKRQTWVEGLGEAIVNPGTPMPMSKLITADDVKDDEDPNSMKGFAVFRAENMEKAIEIAKTDPFLEIGGTIRLSLMKQMS